MIFMSLCLLTEVTPQLGYYISLMGGIRAVNLLVIMPCTCFTSPSLLQTLIEHVSAVLISRFKPKAETRASALPGVSASLARVIGKPRPTLTHLRNEMSFDILLVRASLCIDFFSHFFVFMSPASAGPAFFVLFTSMNSLGAGVHPAVSSIALCVLQMRQYAREMAGENVLQDDGGAGRLFGALSVLQALGQFILGVSVFHVQCLYLVLNVYYLCSP